MVKQSANFSYPQSSNFDTLLFQLKHSIFPYIRVSTFSYCCHSIETTASFHNSIVSEWLKFSDTLHRTSRVKKSRNNKHRKLGNFLRLRRACRLLAVLCMSGATEKKSSENVEKLQITGSCAHGGRESELSWNNFSCLQHGRVRNKIISMSVCFSFTFFFPTTRSRLKHQLFWYVSCSLMLVQWFSQAHWILLSKTSSSSVARRLRLMCAMQTFAWTVIELSLI